MMLCAIVGLSGCSHGVPLDDFCQLYVPVCTKKGECGMTAQPQVKRRILANEMLYDTCPKDRK